MYKNFPDTYYRLECSKYFLNNFKNILKSRPVNLWEMLFNLEAFCFFIQAVGSTINKESRKNIKEYKLSRDKIKKIYFLLKDYENLAKDDTAVKFIMQKRHRSKGERINPDISFSLTEKIKNEEVISDITLLINPVTGQPIDFLVAGKVENLKFNDWFGDEDALELCECVYGRIEMLALNAILEINNIIDH